MINGQLEDVKRIKYHIELVLRSIKYRPLNKMNICDLGGGLGLFSVSCASIGFNRSVLVDDFKDYVNSKYGKTVLEVHRKHGVEIYSRDIIKRGICDIRGKFDVITTFDSMEHWHNSPKNLFNQVCKKLRPGGIFILGVPNCVNMRKRLSIPFGIGKWSQMNEWYEIDEFRGHVREADVEDLFYISKRLKLNNVKIYGRNWLGYSSKNKLIRIVTTIFDLPLQMIPSLCSDIYMVSEK